MTSRINFFVFIIVSLFFFKSTQSQNKEALKKIDSIKHVLLTTKYSDSISIAKQHYFIGELYRKSSFSDSAYTYLQKAEKVFRKYNYKYETALALYGIAVCQSYEKDYTGGEVTSFEALTILDGLSPNNDINTRKSYIFNNLGIVFNELGEFEKSIEYYNKSLELKRKLKGDFERSKGLTQNNLAFAYKKVGKYDIAERMFANILSNSKLVSSHPDIHVLALGNYANTLYLSNKLEQLPALYLKALKVCDNNGLRYNSIIIHQHLAEYYNKLKNKDSARFYAYKAKEISKEYNNDDLLKSLLILSEIEKGETAVKHLEAYVRLSDSLHKSERLKRNKFARIRFETAKLEEENIQIAKERMWLLIISVAIIMSSFLLYLVIMQRNRNKELQFIQKQQETNEEIYNLMLTQNESIEEARKQEKKRISEELHDGVLGRLFGTRLSLDSLNYSNNEEAIKTRGQYIDELKSIEQDIRKVSHELNTDFVSGSGFIDIIENLIHNQTAVYKLQYNLEYDDTINWDLITNKRKIHIYRIIQETLHNIYKHANASLVNISFNLKNDVICLKMIDNGSGFDVSKAKSGIGLKNMNSRIKEINGVLSIISKKSVGTTVSIEVPIP